MKNKILAFVALSVISSSVANAQSNENKKEDRYFEINKNIEVFGSILRELDMFYVDTLDISQTVRKGINSMLGSLDPYTEYYNEEDMKDFKLMTTGEYAGIGAGIAFKENKISITEPFEGKPAAKAGLKAGDYILEINGKDMTKCEKKEGEPYGRTLSNYVSSNLKGQPGTTINVKVERPGQKKSLTFDITRELVVMDAVTYSGMLDNNTAYISLNTFTDKSAMNVKNVLVDLKKQGATSLVFDLRKNGGGIMEDAIQIVNLFVPKGKTVLSTKGKVKQWYRTYQTTVDPIDLEIPIAVLIDKGSASASEIVAGSLQDFDRAILVGERTFGKGLVQSPREIPFDGSIKVTTSKYYIPSGRCVQAIDYSHRDADGSAGRTPDSLTTVFYTEIGREVRDGGGVTPDIGVEENKIPNLSYYLDNQFIVFDWVTDWCLNHKSIDKPETFTISDQDYGKFTEFVKSKDFQYDRISEKSMKSLKEVMEFEGYMKSAGDEFKALEAKLVPDLDRDLNTFKTELMNQINAEIIKRYYYQKGEIVHDLKHDNVLAKAIDVLNNPTLYKETLSVKPKVEKAEEEKAKDEKEAK